MSQGVCHGFSRICERRQGLSYAAEIQPLTSVVMGAGIALQNIKSYKRVFIN